MTQCKINFPTWREKRRAGIPNMMDVKLKKPQRTRVMMERMRKLFGGGYWLGIVAPRGAVTSGCMGEKKNRSPHLLSNCVKQKVSYRQLGSILQRTTGRASGITKDGPGWAWLIQFAAEQILIPKQYLQTYHIWVCKSGCGLLLIR